MSKSIDHLDLNFLQGELDNFLELVEQITPDPGSIPALSNFDLFGGTLPLYSRAGGDHIIYVDFNRRYDLNARIERATQQGQHDIVRELQNSKLKAGVLLADVSGHRITDAYVAAMLHQSFLLGVLYELEMNGTISLKLFESINNRFYRSNSVHKFLTMCYGEIHRNGKFRFISAASPMPLIFSAEYNKFVNIHSESMIRFPPIGTLPSKVDPDKAQELPPISFKESYKVQELELMSPGDILVLITDGFEEHSKGEDSYIETRFESQLQSCKDLPAKEIFEIIKADMLDYAPQKDDISMVFIKKVS